jgi:hypothetical protein
MHHVGFSPSSGIGIGESATFAIPGFSFFAEDWSVHGLHMLASQWFSKFPSSNALKFFHHSF